MELLSGTFCFVSDDFFKKVQDPYLKINYLSTKRPHYFALKDIQTSLYWLVPCSSKVGKYEALIEQKKQQHKPIDRIKIITLLNKKTVLLFQDMFPASPKYIENPYKKAGQLVKIYNPKLQKELEKTAYKLIYLLRQGIRFTPTQPDINKIEQIMLADK